jgi:hypothetical protein
MTVMAGGMEDMEQMQELLDRPDSGLPGAHEGKERHLLPSLMYPQGLLVMMLHSIYCIHEWREQGTRVGSEQSTSLWQNFWKQEINWVLIYLCHM